ncbi:hypothetical protein BN1708_020103, partial [Verticillium longisporum]
SRRPRPVGPHREGLYRRMGHGKPRRRLPPSHHRRQRTVASACHHGQRW